MITWKTQGTRNVSSMNGRLRNYYLFGMFFVYVREVIKEKFLVNRSFFVKEDSRVNKGIWHEYHCYDIE